MESVAKLAVLLVLSIQGEPLLAQTTPIESMQCQNYDACTLLIGVIPPQFVIPPEATSVSGSSSDGLCDLVQSPPLRVCNTPPTSVLFNDIIPTLTGLDGDMWASQLLTLDTSASSPSINSNFNQRANFRGIGRVEVVMFNCPQLGIGAQSITVTAGQDYTNLDDLQTFQIDPSLTSCESLVKVCFAITTRADLPVIGLRFNRLDDGISVYLAEVTFYYDVEISCPGPGPPNIILPSTPAQSASPIMMGEQSTFTPDRDTTTNSAKSTHTITMTTIAVALLTTPLTMSNTDYWQ